MAPDDATTTPSPEPGSTPPEAAATTPRPEPGSTPPEDTAATLAPESGSTPPEDAIPAGLESPAMPEDLTLARRPDLTSLVAGIALIALGVLLVLQSEDVLDLSLGYLWPALLAAAGAVLLASGLRRRPGR